MQCPSSQANACRSVSSIPSKKVWKVAPYIRAIKQAHADASQSRRKKIAPVQQVPAIGQDPVRGVTTAFVQSLGEPHTITDEAHLHPDVDTSTNFGLKAQQVLDQIRHSKVLAAPPSPEGQAQHDKEHAQASEAIMRIVHLELGSSKDRSRNNIDRCIAKFGRHNTDHTLTKQDGSERQVKFRAGPDVGSSEVQIAVLTAKINNLADGIDTSGKKDFHNKRNLRLLVHRRQKLLRYLRKRERGGPRWQHLIQELGLTEATWKGEITL